MGKVSFITLLLTATATALPAGVSWAQDLDVSGQLRAIGLDRQAARRGPVAQANAWQPGATAVEPSSATLQAEWRVATRAAGLGLHVSGTLQHRRAQGGAGHSTGWLHEAVASGGFGAGAGQAPDSAAWRWSVGKKVVSWDVGHAFRPNDVVQQEVRHGLVPTALVGRPLLMVERFDADTAWSLVWVNPARGKALGDIGRAADEAALAARVYRRVGAADWHGFARWGRRTGGSLGAAVSWVVSDALELHASLRHRAHTDALASTDASSPAPTGTALLATTPWQVVRTGPRQQLLVGGSWTGENQVGLLVEAWYDGSALSKASWRRWAARNQGLAAWVGLGAPAHAVAGNLAWQASAFSATHGGSLHRLNMYARLSWAHEGWQPALDLLFHPADRGCLVTASLAWQGDRVKLEGGVRVHAGPSTAVVRQLPVRRQAYLSASWAF